MTKPDGKWVTTVLILPDTGRWVHDRITEMVYFIRKGKQFNYTERVYADDNGMALYVRDGKRSTATKRALRRSVQLIQEAEKRKADEDTTTGT